MFMSMDLVNCARHVAQPNRYTKYYANYKPYACSCPWVWSVAQGMWHNPTGTLSTMPNINCMQLMSMNLVNCAGHVAQPYRYTKYYAYHKPYACSSP